MAVTNGYCTLADLKEWITEVPTDLDPMLERRINAASRWIDAHCGRTFYQTTETRIFDTTETTIVDIGDLVSVTTLKTDDNLDGVYETTWSAATDYQLLPVNPNVGPEARPFNQIAAVGSRSFPRRISPRTRTGLIQIAGVWGWPGTPPANIPEGVNTACLIQASKGLKRRNSPEGVIGTTDFMMRVPLMDDPDVIAYLSEYHLVGV